jgi:hypothetical protein
MKVPKQKTGGQGSQGSDGRSTREGRRKRWLPLVLMLALVLGAAIATGCDSGGGSGDDQTTLSSTSGVEVSDIQGFVGVDLEVGDAIVSVRALEVAFQPAMPAQRLDDQTPSPPAAGEGFYQAYVRVQNNGPIPLRVDPDDFVCSVGNAVAKIEPTRSGPMPRSLIEGTSLDLLLTFKAPTGYEPMLIYSPPWYDGVITVTPETVTPTTSTTEP